MAESWMSVLNDFFQLTNASAESRSELQGALSVLRQVELSTASEEDKEMRARVKKAFEALTP